jgi:hypothetical protein
MVLVLLQRCLGFNFVVIATFVSVRLFTAVHTLHLLSFSLLAPQKLCSCQALE